MTIKEGFQANSTSMSAMTIDGHLITIYSKHTIKMKITNSHEKCRVLEIEFIAINIKRYDAILD
jgi:hypothetical protein